MSALQIKNPRFNKMIATGGIGSGFYFAMEGNHDLGRNESRMARRMPGRDYCKQHIICHYVSSFLAQANAVISIGAVGEDEAGATLLREMSDSGINTDAVRVISDANTLYAVCFQYPDSSGGNITEADSACARVDEKDIDACILKHGLDAQSLVLAVPEVGLAARLCLLQAGKKAGSFCVASIASDEAAAFEQAGGIENTDLLAINSDEALACIADDPLVGVELAQAAHAQLRKRNPDIMVSVTLGRDGAVVVYRDELHQFAPLHTEAKASGGAGDAYTAGCILALWAGLPISEAPQLGILLSSHSVTSYDTINFESSLETLKTYAAEKEFTLNTSVSSLLGI